jgi:hypothetical protein
MNNKRLSIHPSYSFTNEELAQMHPQDRTTLFNKQAKYRNRMANPNQNCSTHESSPRQLGMVTIQVLEGVDATTIALTVTTHLI